MLFNDTLSTVYMMWHWTIMKRFPQLYKVHQKHLMVF